MMDPETGLIIFLASGIAGVVTFIAYDVATKTGPKLEARDLLPMLPWEGPPLPRFLKEKPEILQALRRG